MSLSEFHHWVREVVRCSCEDALRDEDFVPDPVEEDADNGEYRISFLLPTLNYNKLTLIVSLEV